MGQVVVVPTLARGVSHLEMSLALDGLGMRVAEHGVVATRMTVGFDFGLFRVFFTKSPSKQS